MGQNHGRGRVMNVERRAPGAEHGDVEVGDEPLELGVPIGTSGDATGEKQRRAASREIGRRLYATHQHGK